MRAPSSQVMQALAAGFCTIGLSIDGGDFWKRLEIYEKFTALEQIARES